MDNKEALIRFYRLLRQHGLNDSHSGNISYLQDSDFFITATGSCADLAEVKDVIHCTMDDTPVPDASLDQYAHRAIYRHNPEARAVIHSHNPYTVALTLNGEDFIPVDLEGQYYFPRVPVISISFKTYFEHSPILIATALAEYPVVVVRGHGVYVQGASLELAYKWVSSLEQSAKTAFLARQAGTFVVDHELTLE
ncbi:MAG: class II aldolase/adducin family protein [Gammaproteobacteria bacterium]|nr:class II aldolase/adducin family protein [Gammaproteobacteria bacterium]